MSTSLRLQEKRVAFAAEFFSKEVVKQRRANQLNKSFSIMLRAKIVSFSSSILQEIQTSQTYHLYLLQLVSLSIGFISYRLHVTVSAID
jgi:hypothetical protein